MGESSNAQNPDPVGQLSTVPLPERTVAPFGTSSSAAWGQIGLKQGRQQQPHQDHFDTHGFLLFRRGHSGRPSARMSRLRTKDRLMPATGLRPTHLPSWGPRERKSRFDAIHHKVRQPFGGGPASEAPVQVSFLWPTAGFRRRFTPAKAVRQAAKGGSADGASLLLPVRP